MRRLSTPELFMTQFIAYALLWLWNDHVAMMLSLSFSIISLCILIISLLADAIEKSKVPRWYYTLMITSCITPIIVSIFFAVIKKGYFDWAHPF